MAKSVGYRHSTRKKFDERVEKTFAMIKPDCYAHIGKIVSVIQRSGLVITNLQMFKMTAEVAAELGGEPAQALNLMVRPGHCRAAMDLADADFAPPGWAKAVWVIPSAPCRIRCRGRTIAAGRRDAVSLPAAPFALVGAAPAHVVTIGAASSATHDGPAAAS